MVIKREKYVRQLAEARGNGMVKIVTGIRRSGISSSIRIPSTGCKLPFSHNSVPRTHL